MSLSRYGTGDDPLWYPVDHRPGGIVDQADRNAGLPSRTDFPVLRAMPTRWHDNDHYGHVNNVTYYAYLDTAVNGYLLEQTATDIRTLPSIGVVVETSCRYLAPLSFPDDLEIGLSVTRLGTSSITYRLAVFRRGEDEPAALATFVHVYVDRLSRTPSAVPTTIRAAVTRLVVSTPEPPGDERDTSVS